VDPISEKVEAMEDALDPEEWDLSEERPSMMMMTFTKRKDKLSVTQHISHAPSRKVPDLPSRSHSEPSRFL